ncbi:MAG TPA: hypothetical protein VFO24_09615 [Usitatibacter sp.]|nr:hypothetical protein [Usitatibacter sp.]
MGADIDSREQATAGRAMGRPASSAGGRVPAAAPRCTVPLFDRWMVEVFIRKTGRTIPFLQMAKALVRRRAVNKVYR